MTQLTNSLKSLDHRVSTLQSVVRYHDELVDDCYFICSVIEQTFGKNDKKCTISSTLDNVFSWTSCSTIWYDVYEELRNEIRSYLPDHQRIWMQPWINFNPTGTVIPWHRHDYNYHGYFCIEPMETTTVFEKYAIKNRIGQLYLGPGDRPHEIRIDEHWDMHRITIAFDIIVDGSICLGNKLGFHPLL